MDNLAHTQPTRQLPQIDVDVALVPRGPDRLDLSSPRLQRTRRGWLLVLTPEEQGSVVRVHLATTFQAADVLYVLTEAVLTDQGDTDHHAVNGPVFTLPAMTADDDLGLELTAKPKAPAKPTRRVGGTFIIRDAGGGG